MKCLYCNSQIDKYNLKSLFIYPDNLCISCRNKLRINHKLINVNGLKIETFYEYDGFFKDLLLQYKECYDEALKDVFLYGLVDYLKIKYFGYKILYVPSSNDKQRNRGFNHLELIFKPLGLKEVKGLKMLNDSSQEGKNRQERSKMIDNYSYSGEYNDKLLIVDDVITTGSSITGVYKTIKPFCKSAKCMILARKRKTLSSLQK